jgi:hypothetical protein
VVNHELFSILEKGLKGCFSLVLLLESLFLILKLSLSLWYWCTDVAGESCCWMRAQKEKEINAKSKKALKL